MPPDGKVVWSRSEAADGYRFYIQPVAAEGPSLSGPASSEEKKKASKAKGSISDNDEGGKKKKRF